MSSHPSHPGTRLYIEQPLAEGIVITLTEKPAHYLSQVLRMKEGRKVAFFNGSDGEWEAMIDAVNKKTVSLSVLKNLRVQQDAPDLWLCAAPLKNSRTEWVAEKATELGIRRFCTVSTQFTMVDRINENRLKTIVIEAAEQCERLDIPEISPLAPLHKMLGDWPTGRHLIYGDESGRGTNAKDLLPTLPDKSHAVLIGPEGGFSETELDLLRSLPYASAMCMGPRVMRADTAAIAALTLLQAWQGDWDSKPAFRSHCE